jgi:hypothetical protein
MKRMMRLRSIAFLSVLSVLIAGPPRQRLLAGSCKDQEVDILEAFLKDPVANFDRIKGVHDLCGTILATDIERSTRGLAQDRDLYIGKLFGALRHEIDERKVEIAIYLFLQLHRCQGSMIENIIDIFTDQPRLFVRVLRMTGEWRSVINIMSQDWGAFSPGLAKLGNSAFEKELREYALSLHAEHEKRLSDLEAFIQDPVLNFERFRSEDICRWIGIYEQQFRKGRILEESVLRELLDNHFGEVDRKKAEILVHMVIHCGSGANSEILTDRVAELFNRQAHIFVEVLKKTPEWKDVIYQLAVLQDISPGIKSLGNSVFEIRLREYAKEIERDRKAG